MAFLTEPEPRRGIVIPAASGVGRVVADNPGPMTYHGTNTYLVAGAEGFTVLDPGPDDASHVAAILRATAYGIIGFIVLLHVLGVDYAQGFQVGRPQPLRARTV